MEIDMRMAELVMEARMSNDLVGRLQDAYGFLRDPLIKDAVERIKDLERELSFEQSSRELAAKKAWEFSDRIKVLETALKKITKTAPFGQPQMIARAALEGKNE